MNNNIEFPLEVNENCANSLQAVDQTGAIIMEFTSSENETDEQERSNFEYVVNCLNEIHSGEEP